MTKNLPLLIKHLFGCCLILINTYVLQKSQAKQKPNKKVVHFSTRKIKFSPSLFGQKKTVLANNTYPISQCLSSKVFIIIIRQALLSSDSGTVPTVSSSMSFILFFSWVTWEKNHKENKKFCLTTQGFRYFQV